MPKLPNEAQLRRLILLKREAEKLESELHVKQVEIAEITKMLRQQDIAVP